MRLGAGQYIDSCYQSTLLHLLRDPACVGVVGGRPRHSLYFVGAQEDNLIHLDPHFCQDTVDTNHKCFPLRVS